MTPKERYDRAAAIVGEYRDDKITEAEAIARIDAVNAEYLASQRNLYYTFIARGDMFWRAIKDSEGDPTQIAIMCQSMSAHCLDYVVTVKGEGK